MVGSCISSRTLSRVFFSNLHHFCPRVRNNLCLIRGEVGRIKFSWTGPQGPLGESTPFVSL